MGGQEEGPNTHQSKLTTHSAIRRMCVVYLLRWETPPAYDCGPERRVTQVGGVTERPAQSMQGSRASTPVLASQPGQPLTVTGEGWGRVCANRVVVSRSQRETAATRNACTLGGATG